MKEKLKELAMAHTEKAVMGLCLLLMLSFVYNGFAKKAYDKTGTDFSEAARRADENVRKSSVPADQLQTGDLNKLLSDVTGSLDGSPYVYGTQWMRPFDFADSFRNEPKILAPTRPITQSNRGLLGLYKTGLDDKRIVQKVSAKSASKHFAANRSSDPQTAMMGMFGRMGRDMGQMQQMYSNMSGGGGYSSAGMYGDSGGMAGDEGSDLGFGGPGSGMEGASSMMMGMAGDSMAGSMMSGGDNYMSSMGMMGGGGGRMGMMGMMSGRGMMGMGGPAVKKEVRMSVRDRLQRFVVPRDLLGKAEKDEKEAKKDTKKEETKEVEEYVEAMVGKHWVEVVATFPHAEQIKEYTKALREPASQTGLRYALGDVQRRVLLDDLTWSPWGPINLIEQFRVVQNAFDYEPEEQAYVVMNGLAMKIPFVQTAEKPFLHLTLDALTSAEQASYTPEELNPRASKAAKARRRLPGKDTKPGDAKAKLLPKVKGIVDLKASVLGKADEKDGKDAKGKDDKAERLDNRYMVKTAMVRFWDFTVVPGRRYQYQVRVKVFNPNYKHPDVADRAYAAKQYLEGPWSEPSDEVYVEPDLQWFVPDSKAPADRATVQLHYWSRDMGEWIVTDFTHRPGDAIGQSPTRKLTEVVRWKEDDRTWQLQAESLASEMDTNSYLLDVSGGQTKQDVGGSIRYLRPPKELIAVNEYGDLVRRDSDADSADAVHQAIASGYTKVLEEVRARIQGKSSAAIEKAAAGGAEAADPTKVGRGAAKKKSE